MHRLRKLRQVGPWTGENETYESRFVSRAEQRETVSSVAAQRTDEDGIIIDWREWPRWRDIEFLPAPLQRYFFLRLNLSFAVPCRESALERKARKGKRKPEKVGIARQSRDRESDETHLPEVRTIMPLLLILSPLPRNPSCSLSLQPLSPLPFCSFVNRGYPKNLARLSFTRVPSRLAGDRGSFSGSL